MQSKSKKKSQVMAAFARLCPFLLGKERARLEVAYKLVCMGFDSNLQARYCSFVHADRDRGDKLRKSCEH